MWWPTKQVFTSSRFLCDDVKTQKQGHHTGRHISTYWFSSLPSHVWRRDDLNPKIKLLRIYFIQSVSSISKQKNEHVKAVLWGAICAQIGRQNAQMRVSFGRNEEVISMEWGGHFNGMKCSFGWNGNRWWLYSFAKDFATLNLRSRNFCRDLVESNNLFTFVR